MLDPRLLRNDPDGVFRRLALRGGDYGPAAYRDLENRRKTLQVELEGLQAEVNRQSRETGERRAGGGAAQPPAEVGRLKKRLKEKRAQFAGLQDELNGFLLNLPNIPDESVPPGADESANVEVRRRGDVRSFDFKPLDHVALGEQSGLLDIAAAAKISGSRYCVLYGALAQLQRALTRFMLELHTGRHGYREVYAPYIVHADALTGTGQLPKFEGDLFRLQTDHPFYLIPTAEVSLTNLCRDRIIEDGALPLKLVAHTPCFRSEAGAYGKDTHGLIRQHQFEKVELVQVVAAGQSWQALEELTAHAEAVLDLLELPYRVVVLCAGDLGFASAKTYDIEVWMPGEGRYREISSCSNMLDFQARRMKARVRAPGGGKPALVHTLNGSGLAVGRTLIALMENHQTADGRIRIPPALQPYMNGCELI
ncbi:MAG: serine--tRNA ligase [Gammaproteobacteria bacterium]|nr:serine--tRNA ligase [Gammaproteobacteria bacterium]